MTLRRSARLSLVLLAAAIGSGSILISAPDVPPSSKAAAPAAAPAKAAPSSAAGKVQKPRADPNVPEKEFGVTLANGAKIKVTSFPNLSWPGKVLRLDPLVPKTDANLHALALNSMWEVYGRQRGSFQIADASVSTREHLGAIVVYALKTGAKFCVYPVSSDEKGTLLAALKVWME
jgi:hypothetical protein